ncbi:MAG: glycosyltransferase family 4 protein [Chitinophagaceae bacterium]
MKVLQVLYSGLGGHGSVVFSLVDGDRENRWEHSLIFYGVEPLNEEYAQKAAARNVTIDTIKAEGGKPWRSWRIFYHSLKTADPELVLLHSNSLLFPAWWYCKRKRKKLVTIEHTPNQVKRRADKWISILVQYLSNAVVLLTPNYQGELKKILGRHFHQKKTVVIPNGIDTCYFIPAADKKRDDIIKLGMAARFSNQKDQLLLVDVIEKLQEQSNDRFQLWLAGDGNELGNVKKYANRKGLDDIIFFTGNLDEKRLLQFYQQLDIYLHASLGETMSTSIMQAMSCGLPIVASDIPGISNLLIAGTGLLVDHDASAFTKAIISLAGSHEEASALGNKARIYAEAHFSNKKMFELYNQLIQKLCIKERS